MGTPPAQIGRNRQWYQLVVSWISAIFCFVYLLVCQDYEKITRLIIIKLGGRDPNHGVDTHIIVQCLWLNEINQLYIAIKTPIIIIPVLIFHYLPPHDLNFVSSCLARVSESCLSLSVLSVFTKSDLSHGLYIHILISAALMGQY